MVTNQLKRGDIVFVRGTSWVDHAIEEITHSPYNHVAMVVDENNLIEAQAGHPVRLVPVSTYAGVADVYRSQLSETVLDRIVQNAEAFIGEKYDYFLIVGEAFREEFGIDFEFEEHGHLICSTLVTDSIRQEGVPFCEGLKFPTPGECSKDKLYQNLFSY